MNVTSLDREQIACRPRVARRAESSPVRWGWLHAVSAVRGRCGEFQSRWGLFNKRTLANGLDDEAGVIHNSRVVPVTPAANL